MENGTEENGQLSDSAVLAGDLLHEETGSVDMPPEKKRVDLADFRSLNAAQESGIDVAIFLPDGTPTDIVIRVSGPDSRRARVAVSKQTKERIKAGRTSIDQLDLDVEAIRGVVAQVISWQNVELDGKPVECKPDNVMQVFKTFRWIYDQVNTAAGDRGRFMKT